MMLQYISVLIPIPNVDRKGLPKRVRLGLARDRHQFRAVEDGAQPFTRSGRRPRINGGMHQTHHLPVQVVRRLSRFGPRQSAAVPTNPDSSMNVSLSY